MDFVLKQPLCPVTEPLLRCHHEVRFFPRDLGNNDFLFFAQHDLTVAPGCTEYMFTGSDILMPPTNNYTVLMHIFGPCATVTLVKNNRLIEFCFQRVHNATKEPIVFKRGDPFMRVCLTERKIIDALSPPEKPAWDYRQEALEAEKYLVTGRMWSTFPYAASALVPFQRPVINIAEYLASFDTEQQQQQPQQPSTSSA